MDVPEISFQNVLEIPRWEKVWDEFVLTAPDAWYRHLRLFRNYTLAATVDKMPSDQSFFIFRGDEPIGLAPVLFSHVVDDNGYQGLEAGYYGIPLPWPCFKSEFLGHHALELRVFDEIERRAINQGAGRIQFILSPPTPSMEDEKRFKALIETRNHIDSRYPSHWMKIKEDSLSHVRSRYKRYIKKFKDQYELSIIEGKAVDEKFIQTYMDTHIKDAGGQFRSRDSYIALANLARNGFGFFSIATCVSTGKIVGFLFVILFKKQAYDGSVAVDPEHEKNHVSHLLKWVTIETLIERKATDYELGIRAMLPTRQRVPSKKDYGISFFKDGWARGEQKSILVAEKFLTREALILYNQSLVNQLAKYFKC